MYFRLKLKERRTEKGELSSKVKKELEKVLERQEPRFLDLLEQACEIELPPKEDREVLVAVLDMFLEYLTEWQAVALAFELGRVYAKESMGKEIEEDV